MKSSGIKYSVPRIAIAEEADMTNGNVILIVFLGGFVAGILATMVIVALFRATPK